jgi:hypothetical protein
VTRPQPAAAFAPSLLTTTTGRRLFGSTPDPSEHPWAREMPGGPKGFIIIWLRRLRTQPDFFVCAVFRTKFREDYSGRDNHPEGTTCFRAAN